MENKNYRSVLFLPTRNRKFQKNRKKYHFFCFISSQNRLKKAEKDGNQKLSFRFVPTRRVIENSKKIAKKFKNYKILFWLHLKIIVINGENGENKNYRSVPFRSNLTRNIKFQKNSKKF